MKHVDISHTIDFLKVEQIHEKKFKGNKSENNIFCGKN